MKVHQYPEHHAVYIELSDQGAATSFEFAPGIVVDLDAVGQVVGFDLDTSVHEAVHVMAQVRENRIAALVAGPSPAR